MRDIIEELCTGNYSLGFHPSKKYAQASEEYGEILDKIQKAFNHEFVTKLEMAEGRIQAGENIFMFRQGFHLGALLMLDLLYEPPQPV